LTESQPWHFSNFNYRVPIKINNTLNSNNLIDYQFLITIDTQSLISSGKKKSDCSDIRFTYLNETSNSEIKIHYWIENGCNSTNTTIWVKVPYIPANGYAIIYMYYGNLIAVSESNGTVTFLMFNKYLSPLWYNSLGGSHSCALVSNGSVYCWGYNFNSQLGDETKITSPASLQTLNYNLGGRYDKTNGIYIIPLYSTDYFFIRLYTSPEPIFSLENEEKITSVVREEPKSQSLSIYIVNLGVNLGKKFMIKLKYEDGSEIIKSIELNQTLKTGESVKIVLSDLPSGIIKRIEIYSIDVCPNLLITIKSVNIEIK